MTKYVYLRIDMSKHVKFGGNMALIKRKAKPKTVKAPKKVANSVKARRAKKTESYPTPEWKRTQTAEGWMRDQVA